MLSLLRSVRSELVKAGTLFDLRVGVAAIVAGSCAWALWVSLGDSDAMTADPSGYFPSRTLAPLGGIALMATGSLAAMSVTSEYESGTIHASLLAVPRRFRLFLSRCAAQAGLCLVLGITVSALALLTAGLGGGQVGRLLTEPGPALMLLGRAGAAFAVTGLLGLGIGLLVRRSATSVVLALLWPVLGERVLASLPSVGRFAGPVLPFRSLDYFLLGTSHGAPYAWEPGAAIVVPLVWALVALAAAALHVTTTGRPARSERNQPA